MPDKKTFAERVSCARLEIAINIEVTFVPHSFLFPNLKTALKKRRFYTTMSEAKSQDADDEFHKRHFIECIKWWHDPQEGTHIAR